jgi:hypothetical protein
MNRLIFFVFTILFSGVSAQAGEIFDATGNRLFYTEENSDSHEVRMSNGIAMEMVTLAHKYETRQAGIFGPNHKVYYFNQIDGTYSMLGEEQVLRLKDKWLVINEETWRRPRPFDLPQGGFLLSKKDIKKRGITAKKHHMLIEIKIKPEFVAEFGSAMTK